ncbi:cytochrome c peroxidase [uncultured Pelagimonas sp.]|uniref:cytochrome-c peroxidase n=1 Tax=uncultured Pelagimonas sp. TaxID=1618102 RepID=UPI00260BFA9B|nr:cytochrome c peroxidase [uncultured Pelagimonas sp.]
MIRWGVLTVAICAQTAAAEVLLAPDEIDQTLSFGPWPPITQNDPSNRVSGNAAAIALGATLFHDTALSVDHRFACSSCHNPTYSFAAPVKRAMGREKLARNSPSLMNLAGLRWYGWGGKSDNLWAASLHPIIHPVEMAQTADSWRERLANSANAAPYEALFGPLDLQTPQMVLVNTAKTLAAYQETLVTPKTAFDIFRDALERGDLKTAGTYPHSAQRGLQLFLTRGNCSFCHSGPRFSNNEFHDAGVAYFIDETTVDGGRYEGLRFLLSSPYTLAGDWSDDDAKSGAWAVRNVRQTHADFGAFRTPSLRGAAHTAPYMHDGSLPDFDAVVRHYNEINMERMHTDGEAVLAPLDLTEAEVSDLTGFLETLSLRE